MDGTMGEHNGVEAIVSALNTMHEGGKRLDFRIARCLGVRLESSDYVSDLLVNGDLSESVLFDLIGQDVPPYTTSLDAAIPGENIVLAMYAGDRREWAAVQRSADGGEYLAWAATEALARRKAALMSHERAATAPIAPMAATENAPVAAAILPTAALPEAAAPETEWQVKF